MRILIKLISRLAEPPIQRFRKAHQAVSLKFTFQKELNSPNFTLTVKLFECHRPMILAHYLIQRNVTSRGPGSNVTFNQCRQQRAELSTALWPKHRRSWEQNGEVRLKSELIAHNLQGQIASLTNTSASWPGTVAGCRNQWNAMTLTYPDCRTAYTW